MINIIFNKVIILDKTQHKAKVQTFTKGINIVTSEKGRDGNYVGKSSLLRSLYHALGADALYDKSKGWEADEKYYYILMFSVNGLNYTILRKDKYFNIFDENNTSVFQTNNDRKALSEFFEKLFGFEIYLKNSTPEHNYELAKPFALFCLNYLDQKGVNGCGFSSFYSISEYSLIYKDLIFSHLGINNSEINGLEDEINQNNSKLEDKQQKRELIKNMLEKIDDAGLESGFVDSLSDLRSKLEHNKKRYEDALTNLNKEKAKLYDLYKKKAQLLEYINTLHSLVHTENANKKILEKCECPLCKNKIENYTDVFFKQVRMDEEIDIQIIDAQSLLADLERKIINVSEEYETKLKELEKTEKLLGFDNEKIEDAIYAIGLGKYRVSLQKEYDEIICAIQGLVDKLDALKKQKKELMKKVKSINERYDTLLRDTIRKYDISIISLDEKNSVDKKLSCSDNHMLTTFWLSVLNRLKYEVNGDGTFFPVVFDNPTDRDFSKSNETTIIKMIFDLQECADQIIVSKLTFDLSELKDYTIANKINLVNDQYALLNAEDYSEAMDALKQLVAQ